MARADRLTALDLEFLEMEDDGSRLHVGALCCFDGPAPSIDDVRLQIDSRLSSIPRYRQVVRWVPFELGRPVWVDDVDFDLGAHIHRIDGPRLGDDAELAALMGRLMSQPLDRARPLWQAWLLTGLSDGRWALVFKVHHCMTDGIAGMGVLAAILDADPMASSAEPPTWTPASPPSRRSLMADALLERIADTRSHVLGVRTSLANPGQALRSAGAVAIGLGRLAGALGHRSRMPIGRRVGPNRVWAWATVDLNDIRAVRHEIGGTVNDVVMAAVAGGYRTLLLERGEDPAKCSVRAAIPVSTRRGDTDLANQVSVMLMDLPVQVADPVERLERAERDLARLKHSHEVEATNAAFSIASLSPAWVLEAATRLFLAAEHAVPQSVIDTVVTNVPGPQFPLYCLGRRMQWLAPYVPISYGVPIVTAVVSYNGRLTFGITGDRNTTPDIEVIAARTAAGISDLRRIARSRTRRATTRDDSGRTSERSRRHPFPSKGPAEK